MVVYLYGGWPFLVGFISELRKKQPGMMTLIAMAITRKIGSSYYLRARCCYSNSRTHQCCR